MGSRGDSKKSTPPKRIHAKKLPVFCPHIRTVLVPCVKSPGETCTIHGLRLLTLLMNDVRHVFGTDSKQVGHVMWWIFSIYVANKVLYSSCNAYYDNEWMWGAETAGSYVSHGVETGERGNNTNFAIHSKLFPKQMKIPCAAQTVFFTACICRHFSLFLYESYVLKQITKSINISEKSYLRKHRNGD